MIEMLQLPIRTIISMLFILLCWCVSGKPNRKPEIDPDDIYLEDEKPSPAPHMTQRPPSHDQSRSDNNTAPSVVASLHLIVLSLVSFYAVWLKG